MPRKQRDTPTRRIAIWPRKDPCSDIVCFTVLGPFLSHDQTQKRLSLSELIELRDQANAQIQAATGEVE